MTKAVVFSIFAIALVLASIIFYYASNANAANPKMVIDSYNARREDLYQSQQRIEQYLASINSTIEADLANQKVLTDKLAEVSAKADLPPPVINTTRIVQEPSQIVHIPAQSQASSSSTGSTSRTPVTRAS